MIQREAVIEVMKENGGFATLGHLYEQALKVKGSEWKTKTPFASIRRIVQNKKYFFNIRPGLWALNDSKDDIPFSSQVAEENAHEMTNLFDHYYYQGLLVQIGGLQNFDTFVPNQDKNKRFLNQPLNELTSLSNMHAFSYDHFVRIARTVDVTWFNQREMPETFIEVEHTTNMLNSLIKFVDLQDFNSNFWIASSYSRKREYFSKISRTAFSPIRKRVKFISYENISRLHANLTERRILETELLS